MTRRLPQGARPLPPEPPEAEASERQDLSPESWPELLMASDVAELFGCTTRTISNWIKAGYLAPIRIGRSRRFPRDQIEILRSRGMLRVPQADKDSFGSILNKSEA